MTCMCYCINAVRVGCKYLSWTVLFLRVTPGEMIGAEIRLKGIVAI